MNRRAGRAYIFVRWSGFTNAPGRLGDVGWAFENVDRLGRFVSFHCGSANWTEKCSSIPDLIKIMAGDNVSRAGYDEVKVFEVENSDPELALQSVHQSDGDRNLLGDPLDETREILTRYGIRGLPFSRGFSVPFLWYNILPGRSVALRKLTVHLFQLRAASEAQNQVTGEDVEDQARRMAQTIAGVRSLGECFVARIRTGFIVGINIALDPHLTVTESHSICQRVEEAVRKANPKIRHIFVQAMPYETS